MKTLQTLIKVQKQKLDAVRRNLASLESQKDQLLALSERLEKELASEIALSEQSAELASFFGHYIKRIRERQARVKEEVRTLNVQIEMAREAVRAEYSEQLKFEQLLERKIEEAKREAERQEGTLLDDIAAGRYARREEVE